VGGPQFQQHIQKVGTQPLENSYVWSKRVIHIWLPPKNKKKKKFIMITKINVGLMGVCSNYHGHEKLQEHELSQGLNKENKS